MPDYPGYVPPSPPIGELELLRLAHAAYQMRRGLEHAARAGDPEAREVFAQMVVEPILGSPPPPSRQRKPPLHPPPADAP